MLHSGCTSCEFSASGFLDATKPRAMPLCPFWRLGCQEPGDIAPACGRSRAAYWLSPAIRTNTAMPCYPVASVYRHRQVRRWRRSGGRVPVLIRTAWRRFYCRKGAEPTHGLSATRQYPSDSCRQGQCGDLQPPDKKQQPAGIPDRSAPRQVSQACFREQLLGD